MTEREDSLEKLMREEWFRNHKAVRSIAAGIELLEWRSPDTGLYAVTYIRRGQHLLVCGDLGGAVYRWAEPITLEFFTDCYLDYFASKCIASEVGRRPVGWDEERAEKVFREMTRDVGTEIEDLRQENGALALSNRTDWEHWLSQNGGYGVLGHNWVEWAPRMGEVISRRCIAHLVGLQMALEQLKGDGGNDSE